jgi:hypothetical protein
MPGIAWAGLWRHSTACSVVRRLLYMYTHMQSDVDGGKHVHVLP